MLNCFSLLKIAKNRFCKNAYFFPSASYGIIKDLSIPLQKQNVLWFAEGDVNFLSFQVELWSKDESQNIQALHNHLGSSWLPS